MLRRRNGWYAVIGLMAALASVWLSYQGYRYFADPGVLFGHEVLKGAIDLDQRYRETQAWFQGKPVYRAIGTAVYPPATYAILGLAFNVMSWSVAKAVWFVASLASIAWLSVLLVRHSLARSRHERVFVALMPFAFYATGAALGNGQLIPFVLPLALAALLMLARPGLSRHDLWIGSLFMLLSLVQPTIAAPFFWIVMFRSPRMRAALIVVAGYIVMTGVALLFQMRALPRFGGQANPLGVMEVWTQRAQGGTAHGSITGGYGTVHNLLAELGIRGWNWPASLLLLAVAGAWVFRHRRADIWVLMGVTAIVARFWTYHRWYNDLLLIVPLIALFRLLRTPELGPRAKVVATVIFIWVWAFLLAPGVHFSIPSPQVFIGIEIIGWLLALLFLVAYAEIERRRANPISI
jgi:hypothetical protein